MPETKNCDMKVVGEKLVITVDLKKNFGPSSTGKTDIVASSGGSVEIPGHAGMKLGLNVFVKK